MKAYKLFRVDSSGNLRSLFIGKSRPLPMGEWMEAECLPTAGFAVRPGWHCCSEMSAPHLALSPKGGMPRVWAEVEIEGITPHQRPASQGGLWFTAERMRIVRVIPREGVRVAA